MGEAAAGDPVKQVRERQRVCLEVQGSILPKFGFEPTYQGVYMSTAIWRLHFVPAAQDIFSVSLLLGWLGDPAQQAANPISEKNVRLLICEARDWYEAQSVV